MNFEDKLRAICDAYDRYHGRYPESAYEGFGIFEFYIGVFKDDVDTSTW